MKKILTLTLVLSAAIASSGCATFENRLAVTAAGDELLVISKYGPLGIASKLSDKDRDAIKAMTGQK